MQPHDKYAASKPKVGQRLIYKGSPIGSVWRVEDALCWIKYDDGSDPLPFIWCFRDGLNKLFEWPSKGVAKVAA